MGRQKLHHVGDEWKCLRVFPIKCTGDMNQLNFLPRSNIKAFTPSVSRQIYLDFVFRFFSKAKLSIDAPHCMTVSSSNTSGITIQTKNYDFTKFHIFLTFFKNPAILSFI